MGVRRGILGGAVLVAVGVWSFVQATGVPNSGAYLFGTLGIAFLAAWYVGTRQYVYIVPAAILLGFGLGILIPGWLSLPSGLEASIFLGALALALVIVFLMYRQHRGLLVPAALLALVAIADQVGWHLPDVVQPYFVPLILLAVGIYMLAER
jgi:phosphoglycerol transferase MdoB-like AlkP superfamily enzyme